MELVDLGLSSIDSIRKLGELALFGESELLFRNRATGAGAAAAGGGGTDAARARSASAESRR